MRGALPTLAAVAALAAAPAAGAQECRGTLSGATTARFRCAVSLATHADGQLVFELRALDRLDGVPGYAPGAFEVPPPPTARTYTLADLGVGRASVALEGGALFTAQKTSSARGEVTLVLAHVEPDPAAAGAFVAHGTYRARLLPVGVGRAGEVLVEASF